MVDASSKSLGYHLIQRRDGRLHAICYSGKALLPNQRFWPITNLKCLSLVQGMKEVAVYFSHKRFMVLTDHIALVNLQKMHLSENSRLFRRAMFLQSYDFEIQYKKGITNLVADGLSRRPWPEDDHKPTETEGMIDATEFTPGPECLPLAPASIDNESTAQSDRTHVEFRYDAATIALVSVPVIG
jgi:RNase H-like domain found in reverse transcriptase